MVSFTHSPDKNNSEETTGVLQSASHVRRLPPAPFSHRRTDEERNAHSMYDGLFNSPDSAAAAASDQFSLSQHPLSYSEPCCLGSRVHDDSGSYLNRPIDDSPPSTASVGSMPVVLERVTTYRGVRHLGEEEEGERDLGGRVRLKSVFRCDSDGNIYKETFC